MDREGERVSCLETYMTSLIPHNPSWVTSDGSPNSAIAIEISSQTGRHLVAARDIAPGEVILCEPPAAIAPKTGSKAACLNCLTNLPDNFPSCEGCGVPLCVPKCDGKSHTENECQILKRLGFKDLKERRSEDTESNNENKENMLENNLSDTDTNSDSEKNKKNTLGNNLSDTETNSDLGKKEYILGNGLCDTETNSDSEKNKENTLENDLSDTETNSDSENSVDEIVEILQVLNTILLPFRILQLIKESPNLLKVIFSLQSHSQSLFKLPIGQFHLKEMFGAMENYLNIKVPPKFAERFCGIIITNTFNIITETNKGGRALPPLSAILNHSCMANSERYFHDGMMIIRASTPIAKGTPVTISYTHNILGNRIRQSYLVTTKFFKCSCVRCLDPTELGSHASSLKCCCGQGYLVPPKDMSSDWNCNTNKCTQSSTSRNADLLIKMVGSLIAGPRNNISSKRLALKQASDILGAQHYIPMEFKLVLAESLLMQPYTEVSTSDLQEALQLIDELKTFSSQIQPGYTRFKGILLLRQLQAWNLQCTFENNKKDQLESNKQIQQNNFIEASSNNILMKEFKNMMDMTEECKDILKYDRLFPLVLEVIQKSRDHILLAGKLCEQHNQG